MRFICIPLFLFSFFAHPLHSQVNESAQQLLSRAKRYADLYNWHAAGPLFKQAEEMFRTTGDRRNELYAHIGLLRAFSSPPLPERSQYLADQLADNPLLRSDLPLRLFALTVKGDLDGEFDQISAREDWTAVMNLAGQIGDNKWRYRAEGQLGFCDYYDGDLASTRRKVADALIQATKANDVGAEIFFLSTTAIGLAVQNVLQPVGIQYAQQALDLSAANPDAGSQKIANQAMVMLLAEIGKFSEAKQLVQKLLVQADDDDIAKYDYLEAAGYVATAEKDYRLAVMYFEQALALVNKVGSPRVIATDETALAQMYLSLGDVSRAEALARRAVAELEQEHVVTLLPAKLDTLAQILCTERKFIEARVIYEQAEALQDTLIGRADSLIVKTALITGVDQLYEHHVALLAEHFNDPEGAFAAMEQGRGRAVVDLLASGSQTSSAARKTERTISRLRLQIKSLKSSDDIQRVRKAIFVAEQARAVNPDLTILSQSEKQFDPISLGQTQKILRPSEVLVEYVMADPHSYALVITATSRRIVRLESRKELEKDVRTYSEMLKAHKSETHVARQLYTHLIAPLPEVTRKDHLIVVADGALNLLPFEALVDGRGEYLVKSHVVEYEPSSTLLYLLRTKLLVNRKDAVLAVGGVPYGHSDLKREAIERGYVEGQGFGDLPNSKPEAIIAATAIRRPANKTIIGPAATESAVKTALDQRFTYVHFAVHAFTSIDPTRSSLVLLSDPQHGEDGFLETSEILQLKIPAKLIVLSACDTASGPIQGQEGVSALSTAFLLAGSRSVVSTLWPIQDQAALVLMQAFYRHLRSANSPEDSLAAAKRDILAKYGSTSDPAYWAGFIVQGSQPLKTSTQVTPAVH